MMFVGVTALGVGIVTAKDLRQLLRKLAAESALKTKWDEFDMHKDGSLDVKEVSTLAKSLDVDWSRNEIAAVFLSLGKWQT